MENLRYSVSNKGNVSSPSQLFSYWLLLFVLLAVIIVLIYLFPGKSLMNTLLNQEYVSEVDIFYSIALRDSRGESVTYQEMNEQPLIVINKVNQSLKNYEASDNTNNLWFDYLILRTLAYRPTSNKEVIQLAQQGMINYFNAFKTLNISEGQLNQLAKDALAINQAPQALEFYERLLVLNPKKDMHFYAKVGEVALWAKQCVKSADYYFISEHKAVTLEDKRYFYLLALKILFQCEQSTLALKLAEDNLNGLAGDYQTYQTLIDLSIKGNQPGMAQKYLFKLLQLNNP